MPALKSLKQRRRALLVLSINLMVALTSSTKGDYLDDYFDQVVAKFNQKLQGVGISSLPVKDTTLDFNRTISGVPIVGTVAYSQALVVDVAELTAKQEGHRGQPENDGIHLFYQINFPNLTIFSNVAANLSPLGSDTGTAELLFLNTSIAVYIDKNYTLGSSSYDTRPYATMAPATNFLPVSDVMDAAARLARLELGSRLLWGELATWCNTTFTPMVTQIIDKEIEFPIFPPNQ